MGGLGDEFEDLRANFRPRMKGPPCAVGELRKKMSAKDRESFEALLADTRVHSTAIARRLAELAESERDPNLAAALLAVRYQAVQRHRRKNCRCDARD
jgi:hypothetical protein